jgi:enoyl-CoA hydratase
MAKKLHEAIEKFEEDKNIRVVIITGAGQKSFISGSDINELSERTTLTGIETSRLRQNLLSRIENLSKPVIAAINGYAFGIGCEIAMACTFRIAAENSKLGQLEINLGIIPGAGGTQRLLRLVGISKTLEMVLKGEIIDAEKAYKIGLVNKVVPSSELMDEALKWAETIKGKSPIAIKYALRSIYGGRDLSLSAGMELESMCLGSCFSSEDSKEGLNAFKEKRKAVFKGY